MHVSDPRSLITSALARWPGQRPAREVAKGRRPTASGGRLTGGTAAGHPASCFLAPRLQARSGQSYLFRQSVMHTWHGSWAL